MNTTTKAKLGDTVTALYGDTTVTGVIEGISGGWVMLRLTVAADLGFRVEPAGGGLGIRPCDTHTIKVVVSAPVATNILRMPADLGGGVFLRKEVA
jgi:hypothetical protein